MDLFLVNSLDRLNLQDWQEDFFFSNRKTKMEARGGIEPPIKVLPTFAFPLGQPRP